jgi:hypothetical protein
LYPKSTVPANHLSGQILKREKKTKLKITIIKWGFKKKKNLQNKFCRSFLFPPRNKKTKGEEKPE